MPLHAQKPMPAASTTYHVDLTPEAARDLLLSSAEEYFSSWRWTGEKAYHKKFWVKFEDRRPYLQQKVYFQSKYPSIYSEYTPWMGLEINQIAFGSSIEIIWKEGITKSCHDIWFGGGSAAFFLASSTELIRSLLNSSVSIHVLAFFAFSVFFPLWYLFLRGKLIKTARANQEELEEIVNEMLTPHLHRYAVERSQVE